MASGQQNGGSATDRILALLAPLAGFGALSYGVGAAIMWLRFATTGFNADEALSVVPHDRVIFLGFRWLIAWALAVGLLALALGRLRRLIAGGRFSPLRSSAFGIALALVLTVLVVASAFKTWSAFTIACDLAATTAFVCWDRVRGRLRLVVSGIRSASPVSSNRSSSKASQRGSGATLLFVSIVGALSAIGWQLEINLPYDKVHFEIVGQKIHYDGIYFGETDGNFYIAPRPDEQGQFFRAIYVYPSAQLRDLSIAPKPQTLCTRVDRPSIAFVHELGQLWATIQQHLRRTGQPARHPAPRVATAKKKNVVPPPGYCPPLA